MKRSTIYITVAFFAFLFSVITTAYYQAKSQPVSSFSCYWSERVASKAGYDIYNTRSSFGEDIDFYHEFTSVVTTQYLFQSNLDGEGLIEKGSKLNKEGQIVGERGVWVLPNGWARIFWTEGDEFWFVQADSLKLAQKVESQCFLR
jgi:hypothetical protein